MRQVLQSYRSGDLWLADVPSPKCDDNAVKIRVDASVVSAGTEKRMIDLAKSSLLQKAMKRPDQVKRVIQKVKAEGLFATMEQVNAKLDTPVPLGYSLSGTVVETGVNAAEFMVGQRVAAAGAGYASHAEFVSVPKTLVVGLPDNLLSEEGAFGTVGAIAMQAVRQAEVTIGEHVGVIGLGLLGNLVAQICHAAGANVVATDLDPDKRKLALGMGVTAAGTNIAELADEVTRGRGLDKIIIAAASRESGIIQSCPAALRHRGRIVVLGFVGMDCPHQEFYDKEIELKMSMSYGPGRYDSNYEERAIDYPYPFVRWTEQRNIESFLGLIASGRVDVKALITHRYAFADALDAYALFESKERYMGIVLNYPETNDSTKAEKPKSAAASTEILNGSTKLALVGAGGFATGVLGPIISNLKVPVLAVVATRGASASNSAKRLNASYASTDYEKVLEEPTLTHVLVATRHDVHAELAEKAIVAGKIVHVEKPLCVSRKELDQLTKVVSEHGAENKVYVGFNRRYSPISDLLESDLRKKRSSPMTVTYRINAGQLDPDHWFYQDPGGRLTAEGCHFIDYCKYLIGDKVVSLSCVQQGPRSREFDSFVVTMLFSNNSQAVIVYSGQGDRSLKKERVEVFQDGDCWILDDWSKLSKYTGGKEKKLYSGKQEKGWKEEIAHFLGASLKPNCVPTWDDIVDTHSIMFDAIDCSVGSKSTGEE